MATYSYSYGMCAIKPFFLSCISLVLLLMPPAFAQEAQLRFRHFGVDEGLSQSNVNAILQDHKGFLWVATNDGLNRYDGYEFLVFKNEPQNPSSISGNRVFRLSEPRHQKGNLWVATSKGLDLYRHEYGDFKRIIDLPNGYINCLHEDPNGMLWVSTPSNGLFVVSPDQQVANYTLNATDSVGFLLIEQVTTDKYGQTWLGTQSGLFRVKQKDAFSYEFIPQEFTGLDNAPDSINLFRETSQGLWLATEKNETFFIANQSLQDPSPQKRATVFRAPQITGGLTKDITETEDGAVWIGTQQGINRITSLEHSPAITQYVVPNSGLFQVNNIRFFLKDQAKQLWAGTNGGLGKWVSNEKFPLFQYYYNDIKNRYSLNSNMLTTACTDREGNIWIGSGVGVNLLNPQEENFNHMKFVSLAPNGNNNNYILYLVEDSAENIWFATKDGGGLCLWDRSYHQYHFLSNNERDPNTISGNTIFSLLEDQKLSTPTNKVIWAATGSAGLNKIEYNPEALPQFEVKITRIPYEKGSKTVLNDNEVRSLFQSKDGAIWIGTGNFGLTRMETLKNGQPKFTYYPIFINLKGTPGGNISTIHQDEKGYLWVGAVEDGLYRFNPETGEKIRFSQENEDQFHISEDFITHVFIDRQQRLWVGTYGGGFNLKQEDGNGNITFKNYATSHGLPNNVVYHIEEDRQGNLWLSTNLGLSRFNPTTETFTNFTANDGLQNNEFNRYAGASTKRGELMFGGINGINLFYPEKITGNQATPHVMITRFEVFNQLITPQNSEILKRSIEVTDTLWLTYEHSVFSFHFSCLSLTAPSENQYAYQLEGFDKQWNYVGSRRSATYTNLDPGTYTFKVKASNNDGVWNETGSSVTVIISPPLYETPLFRILAAFLVLMISYAIYKWRVKDLEEHSGRLEAEVKKQTEELKNKNKALEDGLTNLSRAQEQLIKNEKLAIIGQMVTGVAHEINTPIGAINASVNNLAHAVNDLMVTLPKIMTELPAAEKEAFIRLIEEITASQNLKQQFLGTREKRALRKQLQEQIEALGIPNQQEVSNWLAQLKLHQIMPHHEVLFGSNEADLLFRIAHNIQSMASNGNNIEMASKQVTKIVFTLKSFARKEEIKEAVSVNLAESIGMVLDLYYNKLKQGIKVSAQLNDLPPILGIGDELTQVWTNLIHNAIQAMSGKGTLEIKGEKLGDFIVVSIKDTGTGIPPEVQDRIFDPFFTTKPKGEGTGLGLDITKKIIEEHKGSIWFETFAQKGTTFFVKLPMSFTA